MKRLFLLPFLISIKAYQCLVSPIFGPTCRFYPTCSEYTYKAIERHGLRKGVYLGLKRI
ncbi:MAG: membrane protein insertion efficiency factor YidD, partial [Deltaproteobacteria bacterium]|nr:membrane protein insertion efficiency factor YidD [Deltaproteobacteria bacterium]